MTGTDLRIAADLEEALHDARRFTLAMVDDLRGEQWIGPELEIVNPPLWEIGHAAWFQEFWMLRHARGRQPLIEHADTRYNSAQVAHWSRWRLVLPDLDRTRRYLAETLAAATAELLATPADPELRYFARLALFHEDMHGEALLYTRQTLGYPPPRLPVPPTPAPVGGDHEGDVLVPGGELRLGATPGGDFVFDNEKWAHAVTVAPFRIARAPVTEAAFAAFVDDGGYRRREWWDDAGWRWREAHAADAPACWRRDRGGWLVREFDRWRPLSPHRPVLHVNAHEAEAFCRARGRRLPTEAEWELAATGPRGCSAGPKPAWPWGDGPPTPARACLDARSLHCAEVGALAEGDSPYGCRQMIGNVWQWTASPFAPYPGFVRDPYQEYSEPWFGSRRVLRGGCFATRSRLLRTTWRNFFKPDRRDIFAGFRTAADA